jgi:hypothetical protein
MCGMLEQNLLTSVAAGVWTAEAPVRIVGMPLTTTMTVLRLNDGLLVHSPIPLTDDLRVAVEGLGRVTHLYAPNSMHHTWIGEWGAAYPSARLHAPEALRRKRPDLRIDRVHGAGDEFDSAVEELPISGFRLAESTLFHRQSQTLVVTDLLHQIGKPAHLWTKIYAGTMGFYDRVAVSSAIRLTAFSDTRAARQSLDLLLRHPIQQIVVGHGTPITSEPVNQLAAAYTWL